MVPMQRQENEALADSSLPLLTEPFPLGSRPSVGLPAGHLPDEPQTSLAVRCPVLARTRGDHPLFPVLPMTLTRTPMINPHVHPTHHNGLCLCPGLVLDPP